MFNSLDEGLAIIRASARDESQIPSALDTLDQWRDVLTEAESPTESARDAALHLMALREQLVKLPNVDPVLKTRTQQDIESRIESLRRRLLLVSQQTDGVA